jgi:2-polyprenyl-6-methoxyphenol hydroxylase-like FAD-dependent oxidoreductase
LLAATPVDALLRHPIYYLATPFSAYIGGRAALLGDAAHGVRGCRRAGGLGGL